MFWSAAKFASVVSRLQTTLENLMFVLKREACEHAYAVSDADSSPSSSGAPGGTTDSATPTPTLERQVAMLEFIVGMISAKHVAFTIVGVQPTFLLLRQIAFQAVVVAVPFVVLRLAGIES